MIGQETTVSNKGSVYITAIELDSKGKLGQYMVKSHYYGNSGPHMLYSEAEERVNKLLGQTKKQ